MMVVDQTITGAASGETVCIRRRRIHNLRQKDRRECLHNNILHTLLTRDWRYSNLFLFQKNNEVERMERRRAVVSVIGKDKVGIISKVTTILAENNMNILDISQTILQDFFTMMMIIDVTGNENLSKLRDQLDLVGEEMDLKINIQLEEIFQAMHRI
jgi:ACT domain-containing protein